MRRDLVNKSNGDGASPDGVPNNVVKHSTATLDDIVKELRELRTSLAQRHAELLNAEEAAAFLGVGRTKFFEMVAACPKLQSVKLPGSGRMWRRIDLVAFVARLTS